MDFRTVAMKILVEDCWSCSFAVECERLKTAKEKKLIGEKILIPPLHIIYIIMIAKV